MSRSIGIVVDGPGDFASLKTRFKGGFRILKTDGPRGHSVKAVEIARRSRKQLTMLKAFKCARAIVVLDFEQRPESYEEFVQALRKAFGAAGFPVQVCVAVANRMIENWYLADIEYLSKQRAFLRDKISQKNYEGTVGKEELKKCLKPGVSYSETKHGPQLFAILRFDSASENSPSFRAFLECVEAT